MTARTIAAWIKERESAGKKSGSLLLSIFGDVVAPHGGAVALGSVVQAGLLAGISEQTIRSSVNRLVADGWLASEAMGRRSIYRFSDEGEKRVAMVAQRIYRHSNELWNGEWHIIVANNWKIDPELYHQCVRDLTWSGFGKAADNVFVRPKLASMSVCCTGELAEVVASSMVCFFAQTASCISREPLVDLIARAWDLQTIEARYKQFIDRYKPLLALLLRNPPLEDSQAFAIRVFLIHDFRRIRVVDPLLPQGLLPNVWSGCRALQVAHDIYDLILLASERYVMETMQGPEGKLPVVASSFYKRFGGLTDPASCPEDSAEEL
jgi:phenylacetic acid degradation operon negative regulatory protein